MVTTEAAQAPQLRSQRRIFLVDRSFQLKYSALFGFVGFCLSAATCLMMFLAHRGTIDGLRGVGKVRLDEASQNVLAVAIVGSLTISLGLAIAAMVLTHRVAGPLYVISRYLGQLANG